MGTLAGHLLPGTFFILFGLWHSFITSLRFIQTKMRSPYKKDELNQYKSSVSMPCICLPCSKLRRAPVESYVKLISATIGLLGEIITGIHRVYKTVDDKNTLDTPTTTTMMNHHEQHNHEVHRRDDHMTQVIWSFEHSNIQHSTMYTAFIIGAIVEILMYHGFHFPTRFDFILGAIAFGVEGFLFANHLHGKDMLDIQVHTFLLNAIYGCVIFSILEYFRPNEILFTYGRVLCTLLQGTWFWQIGFVLYPPTDSPAYKWDPNDHSAMMLITAAFVWHAFFILIGLIVQIWILKCFYRSSKRISHNWDDLIDIDNEADRQSFCLNKDYNGIETKFLRLNSEDEFSENENVEFDSMKLLKTTNKNTTQVKNLSETSGNSSIHSSITSNIDSKNSI